MLIQLGGQYAENENARRLAESNPLEYRGGIVSGLRDGEVLHLVAHSGPGTFAGLDAGQLFASLRKEGLTPRIGGIQLHGCESSSSATTLSELVNARSPQWDPLKSIEVRGVPGYHFVTLSGASWSVGAKGRNEAVWESISKEVNSDPSDTNVESLAQARDMIRIANLTTEAWILRELRDTVRDQLTQDVQAVARRDASVLLERRQLESLHRRTSAFVRLTGATVLGGDGLVMAQRAVAQGLEALNDQLESPELQGTKIDKVRAAHTTLLEIQQNLPDSIVGATLSESLRKAGLDDLTLGLLLDAELQHLKDRPLATLRGIRFDEPKQQPEGLEVEQPFEVDDDVFEGLLAEVKQAKVEKLPPQ